METTDRSPKRLRAARIVLGMAAVLLVVLQFSSTRFMDATVWFYEVWLWMWDELRGVVHGSFELPMLLFFGVIIFSHLFILSQPFMVGFYSRARALLWVARLIAIAPWGWLIVCGYLGDLMRIFEGEMPDLLFLLILAIFALVPVGLFLIPARGVSLPSDLPSTPVQEDDGGQAG
ncbi:MAG: hypothetical protein QM755_02240 [Luteolibacter sp.]